MTTLAKCPMRPDLEQLPDRLRGLPVDERGYPVPWFVAWHDGKPEFRAMDATKFRRAILEKLCWVCGNHLGVYQTFVIGPMCGVNRVSSEPPSHLDCALWSARNCPFLSNANRKRREDDLINNETLADKSAGMAIARNPGVTLLWTTRTYKPFSDGKGGVLIRIGDPESIQFYANGRTATRAEIVESIESGLPLLRQVAEADGPEAVGELAKMTQQFYTCLPAQ